jgi:hypothetical protein
MPKGGIDRNGDLHRSHCAGGMRLGQADQAPTRVKGPNQYRVGRIKPLRIGGDRFIGQLAKKPCSAIQRCKAQEVLFNCARVARPELTYMQREVAYFNGEGFGNRSNVGEWI